MRIFLLPFVLWAALSAQTGPNSLPGDQYRFPPNSRRDPWQKPDQVIKALNFSASESVAVIEVGYAYFAPRIAPLVKKVYAVNTDSRAFEGPGSLPPSISTIVSTSANPFISGLNVDTVVLVDILRNVPQRMAYYQAVMLGLKPGGRLVIIDRKFPAVFPASMIITDTGLESELRLAGFNFQQEYTFLSNQYFLVFQR